MSSGKTNGSVVRFFSFTTLVTPNDNEDLPKSPARGLVVGTAGVVRVTYANGVVDTVPVAAGLPIGMPITRVHATGTTATDIHAGY